MAERDGVELGRWRLGANQALELIACKDSLNRTQPVRPFRMAWRRQMIEAGRMRDKERGHSQNLVVCGAKWKCKAVLKPAVLKPASPEPPRSRCQLPR